MNFIEWIYVCAASLFATWLMGYSLVNAMRLGSPLSSSKPVSPGTRLDGSELGLFESGIENLRRVIVLSHCVERPTDALLNAVERNFANGVHYTFLVSKSQRDSALDGYIRWFEAIADVACSTSNMGQAESLIDIQHLDIEWNDYPQIFYFYGQDESKPNVIALKGTQRKEGIADSYVVQPIDESYTLIQAILSDRPRTLARGIPDVDAGQSEYPIIKLKDRLA